MSVSTVHPHHQRSRAARPDAAMAARRSSLHPCGAGMRSAAPTASAIGVGVLGCGTVGQALLRALAADAPLSARAQVRQVAVARPWVPRNCPLPPIVTDDVAAVLGDPDVDVIVEVMGGTAVAAAAVRRALRSGRHVVTANTELIASQGPALRRLAARHGATLRYQAAVIAGVPVLGPLQALAEHSRVTRVQGVLDGASTAVLSRLGEGVPLQEAIARARPADTRALNGGDTAARLAVLAQTVWGSTWTAGDVHRLGLGGLTPADMRRAADEGYRYRLVATATPACPRVELRRLPLQHPLAASRDGEAVLLVDVDDIGRVCLAGPAGGGAAIAAGVLADLAALA